MKKRKRKVKKIIPKRKTVKRKRKKIAWGLFPGMQTPPTILKKLELNCLVLKPGETIEIDIQDARKIATALNHLFK